MSDEKINLEWIGRVLTMTTEMRDLQLRFSALEDRFAAMESRFGAMETRIGAIERRFHAQEERMSAMLAVIVRIAERVAPPTEPKPDLGSHNDRSSFAHQCPGGRQYRSPGYQPLGPEY